jgi:hypothetical protein
MIKKTTYRMDRNTNDGMFLRSMEENMNIIGMWEVKDEAEYKAIKALPNEFTVAQFALVVEVVAREAKAKIDRHIGWDTDYSRTVITQTRQALERFTLAAEEIKNAMMEAAYPENA